jgi:hypothetical protein
MYDKVREGWIGRVGGGEGKGGRVGRVVDLGDSDGGVEIQVYGALYVF